MCDNPEEVALGSTFSPEFAVHAAYGGQAEDDLRNMWGKITGGPSDKSTGASGLRAQIAREQWADYKKRFQPIENRLLGYAKDPKAFAEKNKGLALERVQGAYDRAGPQTERRLESYGLQITPEMQDRIAKRLNYDRGLSQVQASNMSDRLSKDQTQGIISGGLLVGNRQATMKSQAGAGG